MSEVLFNWNLFPCTILEASQLSTPIGCLYSPLDKDVPVLEKSPIKCEDCSSYINPLIRLDRANNMWWCPYCESKSVLPTDFKVPTSAQSVEDWPMELRSSCSTVEYVLPEDVSVFDEYRHTYWFIIDCYQHVEGPEFSSLKKSIIDAINSLPDDSKIGIITYDEFVYCHKNNDSIAISPEILGKDPKINVFDKSVINTITAKLGPSSSYLSDKSIVQYIETLKPKLTDKFKPPCSSGLALLVTSVLLQSSKRGDISDVFMFSSSPCSLFPGNIIDLESNSTLRSHNDIANFKIPQFVSASKFYNTLGLVSTGLSFENAWKITDLQSRDTDFDIDSSSPKWTFNIFTGSLDQVGVYEMKPLSSISNGGIYLYDSFSSPQFKLQLHKVITSNIKYNSTITINTSPQLKISRMVGNGHNLPSSYQSQKLQNLHNKKISDYMTEYDSSMKPKSFTNRWWFNSLTDTDTVSVFFDPEVANSTSSLSIDGVKQYFIQFQLKYWDFSVGRWKLRVCNVTKDSTLKYLVENKVKMSDGSTRLMNSKSSIIKEKKLLDSFNSNVFIVLLSRLLLDKIDTTLGFEKFDNVIKDIDKVLIKLLYNFGGIKQKSTIQANPYLQDIIGKYDINESFKTLPSLAYSLRKNHQLIRIFNSSPDETAYYHHWFMKSDLQTSITIIKPKLYELPEGRQLSLSSSNVLNSPESSFIVMDSIFDIIIYTNGDLDLHHSNNVDMVYNKDKTLDVPLKFIDSLTTRPIEPKYIITKKGHSQARYLLARLNPEDVPDLSRDMGLLSMFRSKSLLTDDLSVEKYYEGLMGEVKSFRPHNA